MARLAVTFSVIFLLFAFSYARTPLDIPETDVSNRDLTNSFAESDNNPTILLPSEKPESDPTTVVELEPENTDPNTLDADTRPVESTNDLPGSETDLTRPPTFVSFRPINRHFQGKRQFIFRVPLRRCRHHMKPMNPRFHGREVPYGDDMILSGESGDFVDPMMLRGGVRQVPARWVGSHHHHHEDDMPRFEYDHQKFDEEKFKRPFRHEEEEERENKEDRWVRFHHHHHHDDGMPRFEYDHQKFNEEKFKRPFRHEEEEEREHRREGGFMKGFRKFLNHF